MPAVRASSAKSHVLHLRTRTRKDLYMKKQIAIPLATILLLAAAVIVVGLIVALIIVAAKKKKNGGSGPGNSGGPKADDYETVPPSAEDELTNEFDATTTLDVDDVPDGVSDLDSYEMEIEDLIDDGTGTSWKDLGL